MDIRVIRDQVVVEVEFAAQISSSGIYLGEGEVKPEGIVVAVGPGIDHELCVTVGDRVMFDVSKGHQTEIQGRKLLVLKEDDIIGICE